MAAENKRFVAGDLEKRAKLERTEASFHRLFHYDTILCILHLFMTL